MSWFGQITVFSIQDNSWVATVEFYDDANPNMRIPRGFIWPLGTTRTQAINDIKTKGTEIKNSATINTQGIIGNIIPIP